MLLHSIVEQPLDHIHINGRDYQVCLTFDKVIKFYNTIDSKHVSERQIIASFFELVPDAQPKDFMLSQIVKALSFFMDYINYSPYGSQGRVDVTGQALTQSSDTKYYDFFQDAQIIYASFLMYANIDLYDQIGKLHWDKFQAILMCLPDESMFRKVVDIRQRQPNDEERKDGKFVASLNQQKEYYKLKDSRQLKNNAISRQIGGV